MTTSKGNRILVTGGAGFIGSQLIARLNAKGYEAMGIDNFNSHLYDASFKHDRVKALKIPVTHCDFASGDIRYLLKIVRDFAPDQIIHLGAMAGVRDSFGKESEYHRNNIDGTQRIIELLQTYLPECRVIYASTSSVYSSTKELPWKEDNVQAHQLNAYSYSKYANECMFKISGLNNVGLRFFTVYGPWGRPDMALFDFTKKILAGERITVYNYGNMKRDFTYVDDILDGIEIVIENDEIESGEIFNIGNGKQVGLIDFINEIVKCTGKKSLQDLRAPHPADALETWSDTTKLAKLGYAPKVDVKEGVAKFYDWYMEYYGD
jgi:UDP-glucuronate 4-epimerase